jgi:hypothetical protein
MKDEKDGSCRLAVVLACSGTERDRLTLKQTLRVLGGASSGDASLIVVDAGVPAGRSFHEVSGDGSQSWSSLSRLDGPIPNRGAAMNLGARRAIELGADRLCFIDADVPVSSELPEVVTAAVRPRRFSIAGLSGHADIVALTGFIALSAEDFARSSGFDESFEGWRCLEEIEFRLRLHVCNQLEFDEIPLEVFGLGMNQPASVDDSDERARSANRTRLQAKLMTWIPLLRARGASFNHATRLRLLRQPECSL